MKLWFSCSLYKSKANSDCACQFAIHDCSVNNRNHIKLQIAMAYIFGQYLTTPNFRNQTDCVIYLVHNHGKKIILLLPKAEAPS